MPGETPVQVLSGRAVRRRSADLRRAAHRTIDDAEAIVQESEAVNAEARQARRAANRRATTQAT
jgi:hypothetical protein